MSETIESVSLEAQLAGQLAKRGQQVVNLQVQLNQALERIKALEEALHPQQSVDMEGKAE